MRSATLTESPDVGTAREVGHDDGRSNCGQVSGARCLICGHPLVSAAGIYCNRAPCPSGDPVAKRTPIDLAEVIHVLAALRSNRRQVVPDAPRREDATPTIAAQCSGCGAPVLAADRTVNAKAILCLDCRLDAHRQGLGLEVVKRDAEPVEILPVKGVRTATVAPRAADVGDVSSASPEALSDAESEPVPGCPVCARRGQRCGRPAVLHALLVKRASALQAA